MGSEPVSGFPALLDCGGVGPQSPAGGFSNASLNGGMVIYMTGFTFCGNGSGRASDALAGLLTFDGNGALDAAFDENCGGAPNCIRALPGPNSLSSHTGASMPAAKVALPCLATPNP